MEIYFNQTEFLSLNKPQALVIEKGRVINESLPEVKKAQDEIRKNRTEKSQATSGSSASKPSTSTSTSHSSEPMDLYEMYLKLLPDINELPVGKG